MAFKLSNISLYDMGLQKLHRKEKVYFCEKQTVYFCKFNRMCSQYHLLQKLSAFQKSHFIKLDIQIMGKLWLLAKTLARVIR